MRHLILNDLQGLTQLRHRANKMEAVASTAHVSEAPGFRMIILDEMIQIQHQYDGSTRGELGRVENGATSRRVW